MRAESNVMPQQPFVLDRRGSLADITFFDEVIPEDRDGQVYYGYQSYNLTVPYREELEQIIAENYEEWLNLAIMADGPVGHEPTLAERVEATETKVVTLEETLDAIFGGA